MEAMCPSCLAKGAHALKEQRIRLNDRAAYPVYCCDQEAARLQAQEDLKCADLRRHRIADLQRESGIPERFRSTRFADYRVSAGNEQAFKIAMHFATNFPAKSVLLVGGCGTGKTMLGCAALNHIIANKAKECRYIYTPDLFESLRERFLQPEIVSPLRAETVCHLPCVFLDDPGAAKESAWTESIYGQIIDARYRKTRPTFMATNEPIRKLEKILGTRSMSRLYETFDIIELKAPDQRKAMA